MIKGLDAVVLIVRDIEKQKKFYRDILGLEVMADYEDAVFFKVGQQSLALFGKSHHKEGTDRLKGAEKGISHLEFRIPKKEWEQMDRKLKETGYHDYRDNYEDADGNLFHFNLEDDG